MAQQFYINKIAFNSKKMDIALTQGNQCTITSKANPQFTITFLLPNFNVLSYNGIGFNETNTFTQKALIFAKKSIINKK